MQIKPIAMHLYSELINQSKAFVEKNAYLKYYRLLGIANKFIHLLANPSSLSRSYSTFRFARGTTLIEIAVYRIVYRNYFYLI